MGGVAGIKDDWNGSFEATGWERYGVSAWKTLHPCIPPHSFWLSLSLSLSLSTPNYRNEGQNEEVRDMNMLSLQESKKSCFSHLESTEFKHLHQCLAIVNTYVMC